MLTKNEAIALLNQLGAEQSPFSFYCDFLGEKWEIATHPAKRNFRLEINHSGESGVRSQKLGVRSQKTGDRRRELAFRKFPIPFPEFKKAFDRVIREINIGNSFLTNLTFRTPIETNLSLDEIFEHAQAKYKLLVPGQFVVFSPETFVRIENDRIYSYPMKGTIDAGIPNAKQIILDDVKETAEHVTIVDLIRNDLSQVAERVTVNKFRFIDEIKTHEKRLLQVSSEVIGQLAFGWKTRLGNILTSLLPAGSISGAPKPETLRIIREVENYDRGFYTGICGHFDGDTLDTGVMIRFIRQEPNRLVYCSGGGITSFSEAEKEYKEMVDKVYLPF